MAFYTPLRYPGGKRRLTPVVKQLLDANKFVNIDYVEPYAGGSALALALLFEERASRIHINDLARPVFAFWHTVLHSSRDLCQRIRSTRVSMAEWRRQREIFEGAEAATLEDLGFAAFFMNRTNRSGILAGGVIGGQGQTGKWGLAARFNKEELVLRIQRIARYRSRIYLYQRDALEFTREVVPQLGAKAFLFYDPPYIENGDGLYLNNYDTAGHLELSLAIAKLAQPWVVTYDSAAIRVGLFPHHRQMIYGLSYSAADRYRGEEAMFFADQLNVPASWVGTKPVLIAGTRNGAEIYGCVRRPRRAAAAARVSA